MGVHPRNKCHINYLSPLLGTHCAAKSQHIDIKEPSSVIDHHLLSIISGDFIFLKTILQRDKIYLTNFCQESGGVW